jgi:hypothetical protein
LQIWTWTGAGAPLTVELSTLVCNMWEKELDIGCEVNVGEEVSIKGRQYGGQIPGEYIVRTNEHTFDPGGGSWAGTPARALTSLTTQQ